MKTNNTGCALCDSTWGNYYRTVEAVELFFCCEVCANIFEDIIKEIKNSYRIKSINKMEIIGDTRIRTFNAFCEDIEIHGKVTLNRGKIKEITFY